MQIKSIILIVVFRGVFDIIFAQLLKIKPELFSPIYKITEKWRGRKIYELLALLIISIPWAIVSIYLDLNYIFDGIIGGFILTICNIAFREPKKLGN